MRIVARIMVMVLPVGGLVAVAAVPASAAPGWKVVRKLPAKGQYGGFDEVEAVGRDYVWAFSSRVLGDRLTPRAHRWNGRRWTAVALPKGLTGLVTDVAATSRTNAWATVSDTEGPGGGRRAVLRWNGKSWKLVRTFAGRPQAVLTFGPRNVWVFGASGADAGSGTWHYDGRAWTRTVLPDDVQLSGADGVSAADIWASARDDTGTRKLWHYNGRAWAPVDLGPLVEPDTDTGSSRRQDVVTRPLALAEKRAWTTVVTLSGTGDEQTRSTAVLRWNGARWSKAATRPGFLEAVGPAGSGALWFAAVPEDATGRVAPRLRSASGRWTAYRAPRAQARPGSLAVVPGALWTLGAARTGTDGVTAPTLWRLVR